MKRYDALSEAYYKNNISPTRRGGYSSNLRYDDCDVVASIFHYVCDKDGTPLTYVNHLPEFCQDFLRVCTNRTRRAASLKDTQVGETCIRIVWYPMQELVGKNLGKHKDFCYLTVPLLDSMRAVGPSFYGQMAEEMGHHKAIEHCFRPSDFCDRTYVVGFVQLPFDTELPNGRQYVDVLNEVCAAADSQHTVPYKV